MGYFQRDFKLWNSKDFSEIEISADFAFPVFDFHCFCSHLRRRFRVSISTSDQFSPHVLALRANLFAVLTFWPIGRVWSWCTGPSGQFWSNVLAVRDSLVLTYFLSPFPFKILAVLLNYDRSYFLIFLFVFFNMRDPAGFSGYRGIGMHFHKISRFPALIGYAAGFKKNEPCGSGMSRDRKSIPI